MLDTHKNPKTIFLVAARAVAVSLSTLGNLLLSDRDNVDGDRLEAKMLEEVLGLGVDVELATLGVLGEVQSGDLRNELILALTLLLLKLEGDTTDRATLNSLHQVGGVTSNLVAETLGSDDGDLITDALVGLEVQGQSGVVTLNDDLGGLLDGLGTNATHFGGIGLLALGGELIEVSLFSVGWQGAGEGQEQVMEGFSRTLNLLELSGECKGLGVSSSLATSLSQSTAPFDAADQ